MIWTKPEYETDEEALKLMGIMGIDAWCGACERALSKGEKYCSECGQRIDWSDEE